MSSILNQVPQIPVDHTATHEDFELFRRLLRVARLLNPQQAHDIANRDVVPPPRTHRNGAEGGTIGKGVLDNLRHGDTGVDGYDIDPDDDEDSEYEEENEKGEQTDRLHPPPAPSPLAGPNTKPIRTSPRRHADHQPSNNIKTAAQPQQQQPQQPAQRPHSSVEKRYRSVVNRKIEELSALIPASNRGGNPSDSKTTPSLDQAVEVIDKVPTKSIVLDRAMRHLEQLVSEYNQSTCERDELRGKLQAWLDNVPVQDTSETVGV
ncbi:hypothetical protein PFICI_00154 [Pestalotiopsis fici W106-1]|uniref:BHLH domain-containing protein n=1 Tax=Pestalotiopsis fici (strain W106-1 / CGMCC3.15140) TaxID=1229662 RepID=W3XM42_PESFW|nr:uncharacterized protein PFICI_00154 [Pestalotiopsis fici W106-1]ETS86326.1 hypothetical protein PFICI_00154 [Pestalotiopsis fici W106-1]